LGGQAIVEYTAYPWLISLRLGREVALKLLPTSQSNDASARDLVEREARIVADRALTCLEDAVANRESFGIFLKVWLSFRPLKSESRFESLLTQIGLGP
jgi:hypothetical protein